MAIKYLLCFKRSYLKFIIAFVLFSCHPKENQDTNKYIKYNSFGFPLIKADTHWFNVDFKRINYSDSLKTKNKYFILNIIGEQNYKLLWYKNYYFENSYDELLTEYKNYFLLVITNSENKCFYIAWPIFNNIINSNNIWNEFEITENTKYLYSNLDSISIRILFPKFKGNIRDSQIQSIILNFKNKIKPLILASDIELIGGDFE